jgi:hypothetical protein
VTIRQLSKIFELYFTSSQEDLFEVNHALIYRVARSYAHLG